MYQVNVNKLQGKIVEKGYTKSSFANKIGITRETLRNYFNDSSKIPYSIISAMADVLECSKEEAMNIFFAT